MKRLWAPWRMKYVAVADVEADGCVFCEAVTADNDRERLIVHRGERTFTIMNLYPYTNGHLMVVPCRHVGDVADLDEAERLELMNGVITAVEALKRAVRCQGQNLGANLGRIAGAGVEGHVHMHVVPRWKGDVNFMAVMDDTRVISEGLTDTYDKLIAAYAELV